MGDMEELASDRADLYFVRTIETRAAVGIFFSSWGGLQLHIPNPVDFRRCEAAKLWVSGGVLFVDTPLFREQVIAEGYAYRCILTDGLAQQVFDDDGRQGGASLDFQPLYRPFEIEAMVAEWSDAQLRAEWSEQEGFRSPSGSDEALGPTGLAIKKEMLRRGLALG